MFELMDKKIITFTSITILPCVLQGVPETIANLAKADIKIWVLTGDKQETAINIGNYLNSSFSCHNYLLDKKKRM